MIANVASKQVIQLAINELVDRVLHDTDNRRIPTTLFMNLS